MENNKSLWFGCGLVIEVACILEETSLHIERKRQSSLLKPQGVGANTQLRVDMDFTSLCTS